MECYCISQSGETCLENSGVDPGKEVDVSRKLHSALSIYFFMPLYS